MKSIKLFLRKIDIFGILLTFKYKKEDKYSTALGGLVIILFSILALTFGIYYFIPFYNRQNLSIIYYTMNIPKTEKIRHKDSDAAFGIGLDCESNGRFKVEQLVKLEAKHVIYNKLKNGTYYKVKKPLQTHKCKYQDFYNKYNDSFDYLKLKDYECLDDYGGELEGIYSDPIFSYYEFSVDAIRDTDETFNNIDEYLMENDCKLQVIYMDITIDLENYKEPIKQFLNSFFIQMNPTLYIKRNVFFMNQYLYDDDDMLGVFNEKEEPRQIKTLFSRYEEYSLYIGLNRELERKENYLNYAKIYMRADLKRTVIKRIYQKLTEFYADASSILIALYEVLIIIVSIINTFYAENSIIKKLFIFKGIDNKHLNIHKYYPKIKELISYDNEKNPSSSRNTRFINFRSDTKDFTTINTLDINEENTIKNPTSNRTIESNARLSSFRINKSKLGFKNNMSREFSRKTIQRNSHRQIQKRENNPKFDQIDINDVEINKVNTLGQEEVNIPNIPKTTNINYSFSLIEIITSLLFPCLLTGNLKLKNKYYENGNDFLFSKLDIISYFRNMILIDIINETLLDDKKANIINFLSRPALSSDKKDKNEEQLEMLYHNYTDKEFEQFYEGFKNLLDKPDKINREKNLILLSKKKLKELI